MAEELRKAKSELNKLRKLKKSLYQYRMYCEKILTKFDRSDKAPSAAIDEVCLIDAILSDICSHKKPEDSLGKPEEYKNP